MFITQQSQSSVCVAAAPYAAHRLPCCASNKKKWVLDWELNVRRNKGATCSGQTLPFCVLESVGVELHTIVLLDRPRAVGV